MISRGFAEGEWMAEEIELKLELTPDAADRIEAAGLFSGDPARAELRSIYFDTADHRLAKAGLSLRIRRSGGKRIQTIKAGRGGATGLFARSEWERSVKNDRPVLDDSTPIRLALGGKADAVAPVFQVEVERRSWNIREDNSMIELVLDRGDVLAGDRRSALCEIELELKDGDPAALFAVARKIDAVAPVRIGVLTKSERGYRLRGPLVEAVKAEPVALDRGMSAAEAFQHIARACLRQYRLNEALLLQARGHEALHQARVGLRRLRSAFSIYTATLVGDGVARLRDDLRWLAGALGDARDLDVLVERSGTGPLRHRLEAARGDAYARVEQALGSTRVRALMLDLAAWIADGDWLRQHATRAGREQPSAAFAAKALDRFLGRVTKRGRDLAALDDEARHDVRKNAKKLRYTAEFFAGLFDTPGQSQRYKKFTAALEHVQDELGALNDIAAAPAILDRLGLGDDPDAAMLLAVDRKEALLENAVAACEALSRAKRFWR
jgi:inorganic triphosphatase YgiF